MVSGALIGLLGGLVGLILGTLRMPALLRNVGETAQRAVGTNLAVGVCVGVAGVIGHAPEGVDWDLLALGRRRLGPGAVLGARLTGRLSTEQLLRAIGALLVVAGSGSWCRPWSDRPFTPFHPSGGFSVTSRGFCGHSLTSRGGATSDQPGGTQGGGSGVRGCDLGGGPRPGRRRRPHGRPPRPQQPEPGPAQVEIQLLGVNDFHGHLEPPRRGLGGAAPSHAHLDRAERSHPGRTIRVHAGDMVGASPLLSSHFHDEPSVRAMNLMDFDVGTLGNHEFDEGGDELVRLLRGGQRRDGLQFKRDERGRPVNTSAPGLRGRSLSLRRGEHGRPRGRAAAAAHPHRRARRRADRLHRGHHDETPDYLLARHKDRFDFLDISDTVNRYAAQLQREGVEAIVVLAHSGAKHEDGTSGAAAGEIIDEAREMTDAVDVVIAGHTHSHLNTRVPNRSGGGDKLVIEAKSLGVAYDRVRMTIDRASGDVTGKSGDTPSDARPPR